MTDVATDPAACEYIIDLIYERTGIKLHDGKEALIKARLGKRIRHHGLASLSDYVEFLSSSANEEEITLVVDALTTNFTSFLREKDHFDHLVGHALPQVLPRGQKKFRIWCAASSSGEEPYTLAMYLAEHYPIRDGWDWRITASDISTKVLAVAKRAVYPDERVQTVPPDWLRRYFQKGTGQWAGQVRVRLELAHRVAFRQLNLIAPYDHDERFAVIFCRNVMIYFDRPTQEQIVNRLCQHLLPNGYLFIGHAESLNGQKVPLRCLKPSIYQLA